MKLHISTESGSVYLIDMTAKTWTRNKGPNAEDIRTNEGEYTSIDFVPLYENRNFVGEALRLICPPINPPFPRMIISTKIVRGEITE